MKTKTKRTILRYVDRWPFWLIVDFLILGILVAVLVGVNNRANRAASEAAREQAVRIADRNANASASYRQCVGSIPVLRKIDRFIRGVQLVHDTLYRNALAVHASTKPGTPVYRSQAENLERLRRADLAARGVEIPIPTKAKCLARRQLALRKNV